MRIILLWRSSRNISLKLIAEEVFDLIFSLHLKYIRIWKKNPIPHIMPEVIRYSLVPTPSLPVIIQTTVMNTPEMPKAKDFNVLAIPAALLVSAGSFDTKESIPCEGMSAKVIETFQSINIRAM